MQIRDSNRAMLLAAAMQYQCNILDLGIAKDNKSDIEMLFDKALAAGAHIILSSGGVSMGDKDLVKPILKIKGNVHFDKVRTSYNVCLRYSEMIHLSKAYNRALG